jgi:DNA-binding transcriptional ArsR family regulator
MRCQVDQRLREEVAQLHAQICGGLADSNRILLLYVLAEQPRNVTDLAHRLGLPQPTVSRHLKILRERGIVVAERDGQSVFYSLADERIIVALDLLRQMLAVQLENQGNLAHEVAERLTV